MKQFTMYICLFVFALIPRVKGEDKLVIVGTGSGDILLKSLASEFMKQQSGITVIIPRSIGSGGGIKAVADDKAIVACSARDISNSERNYNLTAKKIVRFPVVFYVNNSVAITHLLPHQLCSIFDGTVKVWSELGGNEKKIKVIRREEGDSSLSILKKQFPGFSTLVQTRRSKLTLTDQQAISACENQTSSIAYGAWPNIKQSESVHALNITGIPPLNKQYPYMAELSLIFKEKNNTGALKEFLSFLDSKAARDTVLEGGGVCLEAD